jgi:HAD superfamily hydrolase (TIGR01509 family)
LWVDEKSSGFFSAGVRSGNWKRFDPHAFVERQFTDLVLKNVRRPEKQGPSSALCHVWTIQAAPVYNIAVMQEAGRIKAAIFDLDGLMIDSERISLRVWRGFLDEFGRSLSDDAYREMIGMNTHASAAHVKRTTGIPMTVEEIVEVHRGRLYQVIGEDAEPMPGLLELIDALKQRGIKLGVASNSPSDYVERALKAIDLKQIFPVVVAADQVQHGKPAPDVYLQAAARLHVEPDACLAIEDSPIGLESALAAGMRCAVVPNDDLMGADYPGAYAIYRSLPALHQDLPQLLRDPRT